MKILKLMVIKVKTFDKYYYYGSMDTFYIINGWIGNCSEECN
jgi:hypothetical protein